MPHEKFLSSSLVGRQGNKDCLAVELARAVHHLELALWYFAITGELRVNALRLKPTSLEHE